MTPRRVALLLLVAVAALLAVPVGAGSARTSLDAVAASLTATPVYNDTSAERAMTSAETQALIADVRETGLPYFIAVLPASTLDTQYPTPNDVLAALPDKVNRPGIYAVVVGNDFRAGSTRSPTVTDLADAAIKEYRGAGTYAVLQGFVAASAERYGGTVPTSFSEANPSGFPWVLAVLLGAGVAGGGLLIYRSSQKNKQRRARELRDVTGVLEEDITEYGERLTQFDMSDSRLDQPARDQLEAALDSYEKAKSALASLSTPADAGTVTTHLEDGRYAVACVAARPDAGSPTPVLHRSPPRSQHRGCDVHADGSSRSAGDPSVCAVRSSHHRGPRSGAAAGHRIRRPIGALLARWAPVRALRAGLLRLVRQRPASLADRDHDGLDDVRRLRVRRRRHGIVRWGRRLRRGQFRRGLRRRFRWGRLRWG